MNINLNAFRINQRDTTVYLSFLNCENDNFRYVESILIKNSKDEFGAIFHIKNQAETPIQSGNDTMTFTADFEIETEKIRVFYWNDSDLLSDNLDWFENFLEQYGLDENAPIDFNSLKNKGVFIPRQAGNGGVVGIINIP